MRQQQVSRDLQRLCLLLSQTDSVQPHEATGSVGKDRTKSPFHLPRVCIKTSKWAADSAFKLSRWTRQVAAVHSLDAKLGIFCPRTHTEIQMNTLLS